MSELQSNSSQISSRLSWIESILLKPLNWFESELARDCVIQLLMMGLVPTPAKVNSSRLQTEIAGIQLPNPLGLAAGFDKDAKVIDALSRMGFGFIEVGAVTPKPQFGNKKPRLFRLNSDKAVINRFGFNNQGSTKAAIQLSRSRDDAIVGLNVGANHNSEDRIKDYGEVIQACGSYVDFVTINVSSPNTSGLQQMQKRFQLRELLASTNSASKKLQNKPRMFLKLAPDLPIAELHDAAEIAAEAEIDAIIATNSLAVKDGAKAMDGRPLHLTGKYRSETGGLSGRPIFDQSTRTLGEIYHITEGKIPLIGVGGIETASDAFTKIEAGASALQLYSALAFRGFSLISEILSGLDNCLKQRGFNSVQDAVGTNNSAWRMS